MAEELLNQDTGSGEPVLSRSSTIKVRMAIPRLLCFLCPQRKRHLFLNRSRSCCAGALEPAVGRIYHHQWGPSLAAAATMSHKGCSAAKRGLSIALKRVQPNKLSS